MDTNRHECAFYLFVPIRVDSWMIPMIAIVLAIAASLPQPSKRSTS